VELEAVLALLAFDVPPDPPAAPAPAIAAPAPAAPAAGVLPPAAVAAAGVLLGGGGGDVCVRACVCFRVCRDCVVLW
jgi:hypothetical protein